MKNISTLHSQETYFFHSKKTAAEAHRELQKFYGDAALSGTTCCDWFRRFKNGDFDVDDRPLEGRPKIFDAELEVLPDEDPSQTQHAEDFIVFMDNPDNATLPPSLPKPKSANGKHSSPTEQSTANKQGPSSKQSRADYEHNPSSKQIPPSEQSPSSDQSPDGNQSLLIHTHPPLLTLNKGNFKDTIALKDPTLVFFYATWCGSCRKFKPKYQEVAKELAAKIPLRFALYDCTENEEDVLDEYEIVLFPTLKLFREGKYERDYDGQTSREELTAFATKWGKQIDEL